MLVRYLRVVLGGKSEDVDAFIAGLAPPDADGGVRRAITFSQMHGSRAVLLDTAILSLGGLDSTSFSFRDVGTEDDRCGWDGSPPMQYAEPVSL